METATFNPAGGAIIAKATFLGNMVADYEMYLKENNSNLQTTLLQGDNLNPNDDSVTLPTPIAANNGRRVKLETGFYGNNPNVDKTYKISLQIFQDGKLIGSAVDQTDPTDPTTQLSGKAQYSLLFVKLVAKS